MWVNVCHLHCLGGVRLDVLKEDRKVGVRWSGELHASRSPPPANSALVQQVHRTAHQHYHRRMPVVLFLVPSPCRRCATSSY